VSTARTQGKVSGRPGVSELDRRARVELATGTGIIKVAKLLGLGNGTVQWIKQEMTPTA
jgi:hypothetical protein